MINDLLARGAREGVFRAGIDPVQLYVSIASLGYFYLSNAYTLSTIFGRDLCAPRAKDERIAHVVDLVLARSRRPRGVARRRGAMLINRLVNHRRRRP